MTLLNVLIENELKSAGASLVGFADLSGIAPECRSGLKYGISLAIAVEPRIFADIEKLPNREYYSEYKSLNEKLGELCLLASGLLIQNGFKAVPLIPEAVSQDDETLSTLLPFKSVAVLAGLGWIGKSALLVTKEYGSAVRLAAVLSDAAFDTGTPLLEPQCGDCAECRKVCPGSAITGANWAVVSKRGDYYDAFKCSDAARKQCEKLGIGSRICGKCIAACPWTKKYLRSSN